MNPNYPRPNLHRCRSHEMSRCVTHGGRFRSDHAHTPLPSSARVHWQIVRSGSGIHMGFKSRQVDCLATLTESAYCDEDLLVPSLETSIFATQGGFRVLSSVVSEVLDGASTTEVVVPLRWRRHRTIIAIYPCERLKGAKDPSIFAALRATRWSMIPVFEVSVYGNRGGFARLRSLLSSMSQETPDISEHVHLGSCGEVRFFGRSVDLTLRGPIQSAFSRSIELAGWSSAAASLAERSEILATGKRYRESRLRFNVMREAVIAAFDPNAKEAVFPCVGFSQRRQQGAAGGGATATRASAHRMKSKRARV